MVTDVDANRGGEGTLDHHAASVHPGALNDLGIVHCCGSRAASFCHRVRRFAVCPQHGPGDGVWSAVRDDAGCMSQGREAGVGGS